MFIEPGGIFADPPGFFLCVFMNRFADVIRFDFPVAGVPPVRLPDPFTHCPSATMLELQRAVHAQGLLQGFTGRVAAAWVAIDGAPCALLAQERAPKHFFWQRARMRAQTLWPPTRAHELIDVSLTNGLGQQRTLVEIVESVFAQYPDRAYHCGGKEQQERRNQWRTVFVDALTDPSVALVEHINALGHRCTLFELTEWWCGKSPTFECRFDRTFYAPRSGARFLLEWMLQGRGFFGSQPLQSSAEGVHLPILFEDDDMVVINKPSRLSSVPGVRETVSAKSILEQRLGEVFVVHRLDLDTSGVLVFAKNKPALAHMNESFRARRAQKHYVARLEGVIAAQSGVIDLPLALNWLDRPRQCFLSLEGGGKPCVTDYEVTHTTLTASGEKTWVRLKPQTGRTHQLRLHCALGLKCPIDGDPFYGRLGLLGETSATRLCLHAEHLAFTHPRTGQWVSFEAPADFPDF